MSGRRVFWLVLPLLVIALVLQVRRAERRWRAGRIVAVTEALAIKARQDGQVPVALLEHGVRVLRETRELDPALVDVPVALGWQFYLLHRSEAAVRSYEEALELEPRAEIYANLGRAHLRGGDLDAARKAFATAVRLNRRLAKDLGSYLDDGDLDVGDEQPSRPDGAR